MLKFGSIERIRQRPEGSGINTVVYEADICVVGLGYIGLPTAAFFARSGKSVIGFDTDSAKVQKINAGILPFKEPGFAELLRAMVFSGALKAETSVPYAKNYVIAVPTPVNNDKTVDTSYIKEAVDSVLPHLKGRELIVLESTVPPGTTGKLDLYLKGRRPDLMGDRSIDIAHCPERVLPGNIMEELSENDRVVGGVSPEAAERSSNLYKLFCRGSILKTDARTAELVKLTENTYRDLNIAFANELSMVCERLEVDPWELIELANHHPRVNILQPGPGVGGHCIAVDPWFIVSAAPEEAKLVRKARLVNDSKPEWIVRKVVGSLGVDARDTIAILGVTFKPDIDDTRQSPAVDVVRGLARQLPESDLLVVEPNLADLPLELSRLSNVEMMSLRTAISRAQTVVILVDHSPFLRMSPEDFNGKNVIDTRGMLRKLRF